MIVIIDNFDSFTYNIVEHYRRRNYTVKVYRNNRISLKEIEELKPDYIILSPGPKVPENAGITLPLVKHFAGKIPIFGVCLGCQAIAVAFGGRLRIANKLYHGKVSPIRHQRQGVFADVFSPILQTRYHSLVIDEKSIPDCLEVTATSEDGEIMGIRHKTLPVEGVQFHPESIASKFGGNILDRVVGFNAGSGNGDRVISLTHKVVSGKSLSFDEAFEVMQGINFLEIPSEIKAALLIALKMKGESSEEIAGFAKSFLQNSIKVQVQDTTHLLDIVGTGGDRSNTFNVSTCSAFVASAAGACMAKHGNRSVSSRCGSADVLEALGVKIDTSREKAEMMLRDCGMAFLFAPLYHPAMKNVIGVRRALKTSTVFNIMGPLVNPSRPPNILLGVFQRELMVKMAKALMRLGIQRALVVSSLDGLDEISLADKCEVIEIIGGKSRQYKIDPQDYGFSYCKREELIGGDALDNAKIIENILSGKEKGPQRDIVLLNAGAGIYTAGLSPSIAEGVKLALRTIDSGKAIEKFNLIKETSHA